MKKRIISIMLSLCMVLLAVPAQKVEATGEQAAMYFFTDILSVSCYHTYNAKYPYRNPFDIISNTSSKANAYAPFDCKVVKVDASNGNMVAITSLNPVRFANGTVDYMTIMLAHDNDISDTYVGKTYKQGEVFYQQGDAGKASGNHIHVELARGQFTGGNIWQFVRNKDRVISINDALYLYDNTKIVRSGGYTWKRLSGAVVGSNNNTTSTISATVTTGAADTITNTSAIVRGAFSVSGARATECGMYLGTSESNLTFLGSDKVNTSGTSMYYSTSKYGRTLQPGTTYYYKAYAIVNGKTTWGNVKSFTTNGSVTNPSKTDKPIVSVSGSNVSLSWNSVANATSYDVYLVQSPWGWEDIKYSGSTKGTSYTFTGVRDGDYAVFVIARPNTDRVQSEWNSFTVKMTETPAVESQKTETSTPTSTANFYNISASNVSQTNAKLSASISYTGTRPSEVGVYFGSSESSMSKVGSDAINHNKNPFDMWYSLNKYGVTLSAGTTYYYKMYAIIGGNEVASGVNSFTTPAQVSSTCTAVVVNTNGQYLAINDSAAASPKYSNKVGRIPPGGTVTVHTDKTSGNWYYVTYNGVSGYAYSKYLSLQ